MKKIGRYIVMFTASILLTTFLVFMSFSFTLHAEEGGVNIDNSTNKITFSLPSIGEENVIQYRDFDNKNTPENTIFSADFGRLANGFFLMKQFHNIEDILSRDDKNISIGKINGIFSLYDPFVDYIINDKSGTFRLKQITNGSIYLANEDDGTITLYSVDMVAELSFLSEGSEKTKMILFPGMYFRFDPSKNADMQGADLLRIVQVQRGSEKRTKIAFVNARVGDAGSQLVPYFLFSDNNAREMFRFVELASQERMKIVDLLKDYTKINGHFHNKDTNIINPTKQMYRVLGELQMIFSQAINEEIEIQEFQEKTQEILKKTKEFGMEDIARGMIEQFLIDGRFALFAENNGGKGYYGKLYDSAANILDITPTTPKGRMLQVLSNIFSRNILNNNVASRRIAIDTISVLNRTLTDGDGTIETSDYFDMSLYSFLLLRIMADVEGKEESSENEKESLVVGFYKTILSRATLEDSSLYRTYNTILSATQKYVSGISNASQIENAQAVLMTEFYIPMMHLLVNSLYQTYTNNESGNIHMRDSFINRGIPELSSYNHREIVQELSNTYALMFDIYERRLKVISSTDKLHTKLEMEKYLKQLDGFIKMLDPAHYREYQESPYVSEKNSFLPQYNTKSKNLERKTMQPVVNNQKNTAKPKDEKPQKDNQKKSEIIEKERIVKILSALLGVSVSHEDVTIEKNFTYRVKTMHNQKGISFAFRTSDNSIFDLFIDSNPKIQFADALLITTLREIMPKISLYEGHIEKIIKNNSLGTVKQVQINYAQKRIQIGSKFFPLPN